MEHTSVSAPEIRSRLGGRAQVWPKLTIAVALVLALAAGALATLRSWSVHEVVIVIEGREERTVMTRKQVVGDVLAEAGIVLNEGDVVTPAESARIVPGDRIHVTLADRVQIRVDGRTVSVAVANGTVRDALVRAGIVMGPLDRVVPVRETKLEDGMVVDVIRVVQEDVYETETIPFRTLRWAEPHLEKGAERVVREGREGILRKHVRLTYENGVLAHREELGHEVVQAAVDRIVGIGTREAINVLQTGTGSYRYTDVITVEATAYYPGPKSTGPWADGYTFTGLVAGKGVVAVDPTVIPLGTRLYIPGYGEAIAADIGGAIKGYRIDLGFDTYEEAIQYGRQKGVKVYILAD